MSSANSSSSGTNAPVDSEVTPTDIDLKKGPGSAQEPKNVQELTNYIQSMLQQMQDRFQTMSDQIISRIDDMGARIDDLEHNINDLMVQAGQGEHAQQQSASTGEK